MTRTLYECEVARIVLALREALVRHDENLKAFYLLTECVPYFLRDNEEIKKALEDQESMVEHVLPGRQDAYSQYYETNVNERPFEQQYNLPVAQADRLPRVAWLTGELLQSKGVSLLDLGCNDGWMLRFLYDRGITLHGTGIDLNPDCIERARLRFAGHKDFRFYCGPVEGAATITKERRGSGQFHAVSCFEVLEHVFDPVAVLEAAASCVRPGGTIYFSTPLGAVEMGEIPEWDKVEPKGHVRAVMLDDIKQWTDDAGLEGLQTSSDGFGLILCKARRRQ